MHGLSLGAQFTDGHVSRGRFGHSHHTHHGHHAHRSHRAAHHDRHAAHRLEKSFTGSDGASQGTVKQALVNQIKITLTQRFELHQTGVAVAGATADEQAGNDLAGAVSAALNSMGDTPPQDAVAAVDDAATGAIQQTAQALPPSSVGGTNGSPSELDSAISQISDQLQSLYSAYMANADATSSGDSVTATGARLITNAKGLLEIHTQEGDTVTLGFASKSGVSIQNLQAGNDSVRLDGSTVQAFGKNRVTVSVQGDLNAAELQAVQDLVDQVNQVADGFFGGDVNAALSQAGGLNFDGSQLSDYSLHLALKQTFEAYGLNLSLAPVASADQTPASTSDPGAVTTADARPSDTAANASDASTATVDPAAADNGGVDDTRTAVAA
jgi:hypothetical protein